MHIHVAYTSTINPPTATSILTRAQVWAGLQRKIRHAEEFVPVIASCEVVDERDGVVTRDVQFKKGFGPQGTVREVVVGYEPVWVDFRQPDGAVIRNIVSDGPSGDVHDLHMTYVFELRVPDIQEGTAEAEKEVERLKGTAKTAVEKSIESIRQMVVDGRITE